MCKYIIPQLFAQQKLPGRLHLTECFENALEIILGGIIMVNAMSSYDIERLWWLCSFLLGNIYKQEEDKEMKDYTKKKWRDSFLYCIIEGHSFVTLSRSKIKGQMWSETFSDQTKLSSMKGEIFLFLTNLKLRLSLPLLIDLNSYPRFCSFYYIVEMFLNSQSRKSFSFINSFKGVLSTYCAPGTRDKTLVSQSPCMQGS